LFIAHTKTFITMQCPPKTKYKIQIVEDHPLTALGLRSILDAEIDIYISGMSSNISDALNIAIKTKPDLLISDISLPGRSGFELVQDLKARCPHIPTLIFSMHSELTYARRALEVGARGYVMKSDSSVNIMTAIRTVLAGGIFVSPLISTQIMEYVSLQSKGRRNGVDALSPKEFEVFQLFAEGIPTTNIAQRLNMSPKTVDSHREHIKQKLEIQTMSELIAFSARWCSSQVEPAHSCHTRTFQPIPPSNS
jgi:DNA-binding NarL/FixJ family response regulator